VACRDEALGEGGSVARKNESIQNLNWRQFEELVGKVFRRQGYLVL
jgi:hypothetical protein